MHALIVIGLKLLKNIQNTLQIIEPDVGKHGET